uniref:Uncharacterized protein n=1 Tax=Oryza brachyantha TaxID=4533 RepID=J3LCL8_ORYBR
MRKSMGLNKRLIHRYLNSWKGPASKRDLLHPNKQQIERTSAKALARASVFLLLSLLFFMSLYRYSCVYALLSLVAIYYCYVPTRSYRPVMSDLLPSKGKDNKIGENTLVEFLELASYHSFLYPKTNTDWGCSILSGVS